MPCRLRSSGWKRLEPQSRSVGGVLGLRSSVTRCNLYDAGRCRKLSFDSVSAVLIPPAVFGGLLISLWTYKCIMMVLFQNKIIYMPSVPPFSRSEKVEDYAIQCRPVKWKEHSLRSIDGTKIKLLEGSIKQAETIATEKHVIVIYFQGNASSLPPRLPYLSRILKSTGENTDSESSTQYTIVALSYRGFWTSSGRPNQPGIELDTEAALAWVLNNYDKHNSRIIVWGQSIGAGAASLALANLAKSESAHSRLPRISGLLLETPFIDLRAMLIALYPQKFLPYRYLAPFLLSTWDSKTALTVIAKQKPNLKVMMLQAGDDELVPADNAPYLEKLCRDNGLLVQRVVVPGALHTEVMAKPQGRSFIASFISSFSKT